MDQSQVHFEVFLRKQHGSDWTLELATEDRARAVETAEELLANRRAIAVKVTKETLNDATREFQSVTILNKGEPERRSKQKKPKEDREPLCVSPQDLYTYHARERIGRLLEPWLNRNRATPFELLHRADLIEKLDASGLDLQHAIQKVAIPEAQARDIGVHEVIRSFQRLAQATIDRVLRDERKGLLPTLGKENFALLVERLAGEPERHYLLGAAVARQISAASSWRDKVNRLLDLADAAPSAPAARSLALRVLEEPLSEMLATRPALAELLGDELDLGASLAAMTRLAAAEAVEPLCAAEPSVARAMPPLRDAAARLANWLDGPHFEGVRAAVARKVLRELMGPRRLRPDDAEGEIIILRALAMALTAAAGRILTMEDVTEAFITRSKMLVRANFIEAYLGTGRTAIGEIEALLWLAENVAGAANKREACRWLSTQATGLRFETEVRNGSEAPAAKLAGLADLQRQVGRVGFPVEAALPLITRLGEVGGMVEADVKLTSSLAKAGAPVVSRLSVLLRFASGEAAPLGPAADRAKQEAIRLIRLPETRAQLARSPEQLGKLRTLMQSAGLAA